MSAQQSRLSALSQVQPSGSSVSRVESDIAQSISLAGTLVTLLREPVTLFYQNKAKLEDLKLSLGHWQGEAFGTDKRYRIPVLRVEEFEKYLVATDGCIAANIPSSYGSSNATDTSPLRTTPIRTLGAAWSSRQATGSKALGELHGRACWAFLLHALGIKPGMGIVGWRPSLSGLISTQNGGIEMEVDGTVLCHIMNIYSSTPDRGRWGRSKDENLPSRLALMECPFPFGNLAWSTKSSGVIHAHFTPGLESELRAKKQPFGEIGSRMEPNTWITSYLVALKYGVSDMTFRLEEDKALEDDRVERFLACLDGSPHPISEVKKPILISYDWLEEAARVKRRVLTKGGRNLSFFYDVCDAIDAMDDDELEKTRLKARTQADFFLDGASFTFYVPGSNLPSFGDGPAHKQAIETLARYESEPQGTFKHGLYLKRNTVIKLLFIKSEIQLTKNMWVLEFTNSSPLWNERLLLGAPLKTGRG
jgi:hypothetical protein